MDSGQCLRVLRGHVMMMMMMMTTTMFDSCHAEEKRVAVGGVIVLSPQTIPRGDIVWKHNKNLVVEFLSGDLEYYHAYKDRAVLDTRSGQLNISHVTLEDSGRYEVDVDNVIQREPYDVTVLTKVNQPAVVSKSLACNNQSPSCNFHCVSNVTGAGPVRYRWKLGGKPWGPEQENMMFELQNDEDTKTTEDIYCHISNPVSEAQSEAFKHPFTHDIVTLSPGGVVAIIAAFIVIGLVVLGVWKRDAVRQRICGQEYGPAGAEDRSGTKESIEEDKTNNVSNVPV